MEKQKEIVSQIPDRPGVYIYKDAQKHVLYVGKARHLSRRVKQYFQNTSDRSPKTLQLVSEIHSIETIVTASEFDALLLEARLIRQYMPKYNVISKDDKSPLYLVLTINEKLPRVLFVRKSDLSSYQNQKIALFGPFQSSFALRDLVSQLRSVIPYCTQKQRNGRPCFYTHLGLCDPCPSVLSKASESPVTTAQIKRYRENIHSLKNIFEGKRQYVLKLYTKRMKEAAKKENFNEALLIKKRIDMLYTIASYKYDPSVFIEQGIDSVFEDELAELFSYIHPLYPQMTNLTRIECFDMSQLFGASSVGAMTVLHNGAIDPSQYRKFLIRQTGVISDTSMMTEVLNRRFSHSDWPIPSFILIDGGKPQLSAVKKVFDALHIHYPYAGLSKRYEELIIPKEGGGYKTLRLPLQSKALHALQRVRDEAHRFAISYHRQRRSKNMNV